MADAVNTNRIGMFDRVRLERAADWLAVAVAVSLPWSTTATGILVVVWLAALLPTLDLATLRREFLSAAGGLPVLLWLLAAVGMLWAQVSLPERFGGFGGFHKLLIIPLLLAQFRRSGRGMWVAYGFLASCMVLLVASWIHFELYQRTPLSGIPVKDYVAQSAEFFVCAFGLLGFAFERARERRYLLAAGLTALAIVFLANVVFVATGRTALAVIPVLIVLLGFWHFGWKGLVGACLAGVLLVGAAWSASPFLRARVLGSIHDVQQYRDASTISSSSLRIEFWKKSLAFIAEAPVIGHGTGAMPELFRRAAAGETGAGAVTSVNPHNQFFGVAIQLGLLGGALLIAMWAAHLALFRHASLVAWFGLVIVLQNVISSLFNSHLFDYFHGWLYVFGVGVLGGMALRETKSAPETGGT